MLRSRVGALLLRPCSNVALLCNHDNKELKEDVDGSVGVWGVELVHDLFSCHICSGPLIPFSEKNALVRDKYVKYERLAGATGCQTTVGKYQNEPHEPV